MGRIEIENAVRVSKYTELINLLTYLIPELNSDYLYNVLDVNRNSGKSQFRKLVPVSSNKQDLVEHYISEDTYRNIIARLVQLDSKYFKRYRELVVAKATPVNTDNIEPPPINTLEPEIYYFNRREYLYLDQILSLNFDPKNGRQISEFASIVKMSVHDNIKQDCDNSQWLILPLVKIPISEYRFPTLSDVHRVLNKEIILLKIKNEFFNLELAIETYVDKVEDKRYFTFSLNF